MANGAGQARLPNLETLQLIDCLHIESLLRKIREVTNQLRVGKAGLPPLV
jgi:hypothetical protein